MSIIHERLKDSIETKQKLLADDEIVASIERCAKMIEDCISSGGKLIVAGNGGSSSDALHFVSEIVGRFQKERNPWPAITLNEDVATMTAIANDYGFEAVFARQLKAYATTRDVFVGISTSGNSKNILKALDVAEKIGCKTIVMTGKDGGAMKHRGDEIIIVPSDVTARIQETHITIIHIICELVEIKLTEH